jgi:serine/threonine protein kinase
MASPTSSVDFLDLVRKSGVQDEKRLDAHLEKLRAAGAMPAEAAKLAGLLVRDGFLTNFQAEQIMLGKWRRFTIGKYKVLERLGAGGMGSVYLCEHKFMRRRVAVKVLPTAKAADPSALERFYREAKAVAALDHPNIVHAYDIDQDENLHFLVMEYVDGASLQEIIKKTGPMDPVRAAHYMAQAAEGLQHAFQAGLVHRDIKPGNILVDRAGTVKILDMGLARFFNDEEDILTKKYDENVLGTADYLAPEQALDSHGVDIRADIYSLGATLYFVLTGRTPFSEGTVAQKLIWHQTRQPKAIRTLRPEVPPALVAVVERMMAKDPGQRYQSPVDISLALEPWTGGTIPPPPSGEMPRLSLAATGVNPGEASSVAPAGSQTSPSPQPKKSWKVPLAPPDSRPGPSMPKPRAPGGVATHTPPAAAGPVAHPGTELPPTMVSARSVSQPALASPPESETDEESVRWEHLTSDTADLSARADTSERSSRKNLRTRPTAKSWLDHLRERRRFWWLAAGIAAVLVGCVALVLRQLLSSPPVQKTKVRLPLRVNKKARTGEFQKIKDALRKARPGDKIIIAGGEYKERIELRNMKEITIAAGEGEVKIVPPPGRPDDPLIYVHDCVGVHLRGLKVDGQDRVSKLVYVTGINSGLVLDQLILDRFKIGAVQISNCQGTLEHPVVLRQIETVARGPQPPKPAVIFRVNPRVLPDLNDHIHIEKCTFAKVAKTGPFAFERGGPANDPILGNDVTVDGKPLGVR